MTPFASTQNAWYFDGRTAARQQVRLDLYAEGLTVSAEGLEPVFWPAGTWRTQGSRIERLPYSGESVQLEDAAFATALNRRPSHSGQYRTVAVLVLASAALVVALWFLTPVVTMAMARRVPESMQDRIGGWVARSLAPDEDRLNDAAVQAGVAHLMSVLSQAHPVARKYDLVVSANYEANALAAPGGHVVVYCGLVRAMESGDELAAVLGHEMTHVVENHAMRNLIRTVGGRLLLSILIGGGDQALDTAVVLGALHYMREDEEAADRGAVELLYRAGIDPGAMERALVRLENAGPRFPGVLEFMSSHPGLEVRQRRAKSAAAALAAGRKTWEPVLSSDNWERLRGACQVAPPIRPRTAR